MGDPRSLSQVALGLAGATAHIWRCLRACLGSDSGRVPGRVSGRVSGHLREWAGRTGSSAPLSSLPAAGPCLEMGWRFQHAC